MIATGLSTNKQNNYTFNIDINFTCELLLSINFASILLLLILHLLLSIILPNIIHFVSSKKSFPQAHFFPFFFYMHSSQKIIPISNLCLLVKKNCHYAINKSSEYFSSTYKNSQILIHCIFIYI